MVHRDSLYSEVVVVPRSRGVARKCEELVERAVARSSVSSLVSSFLFFQRRTADIRLRRSGATRTVAEPGTELCTLPRGAERLNHHQNL